MLRIVSVRVCKYLQAYLFAVISVLSIHAQPTLVAPDRTRAKKQLDAFVPKRLNYFSEKGDWIGPTDLKPNRSLEPLALSHALLASGKSKAIKQANLYIENAKDLEWHRANFILLKYKSSLSEKSRTNIHRILDSIAPEYLKDSWNFVGTNDNFPSMATAGCAMYAEISGKKEYSEKALERLKGFKRQLERSGVNSEYSSQAYCFLQVEGMAMLIEFTSNTELKKLALQVEERFWFDIIGHFYLPVQKMAAPYSRAYAWDMRGEGLTYSMLEQILGNILPFRYLDDYFEQSEEWIKCRNAACYGIAYHCPQYLVDELVNRKYPYSFVATADGSPGSDDIELLTNKLSMQTRTANKDDGITEYGEWQTRIETFMMPKYALSSSLVPYHSGSQTENFLLLYPRKSISESIKNTATIFSRLVVNDEMTLKTPSGGYGDYGVVFNELGRRIVVQEKNTAMVIYKPKPFLNKNLKSLRACIYIPNNNWMRGVNTIDEIWIGKRKINENTAESAKVEPVFIRDGEVYMAYIPLLDVNINVKAPVTIEEKDGYTIISFWNYKGEAMNLDKRDLQNKGNGFVCEVASSDEYSSFEAFREAMMDYKITDVYRTYIHYRSNMVRYTSYQRKDLTIENEYSPGTESIRFTTINGRYQDKPRLKVDGQADEKIPFNK